MTSALATQTKLQAAFGLEYESFKMITEIRVVERLGMLLKQISQISYSGSWFELRNCVDNFLCRSSYE